MKILISEEQKNKLFIPRKLDKENSRYTDWNNKQPIINGVRINQYDIDGKKQGYWEDYFDNGNLYSKGLYKNNEENGYWEYYYGDGNLWSKGTYKNGEKNGYWVRYYNNGNLDFKGSYKDGLMDDICEWYYINGNIMSKELYMNGEYIKELPLTESEEPKKNKLFIPRKLDKENSRYAELNKSQPIKDGKRINQYDYEGNKQGYWEEYDEEENIYSKGSYKDGNIEGYWSNYDGEGNLLSKGSYNDGKAEGIWEKYYENGNIEYKGSFKEGLMDGYWEFYHYNGNISHKLLYKNGKLVKELPLTESKIKKGIWGN